MPHKAPCHVHPFAAMFFILAAAAATVATVAAAAVTRARRRLAAPVAAASWRHAPPSLQPQWGIWWQTGQLPCPVLHVLTGWASGSTIAWAEPVHISTSAHMSEWTNGYPVPRGGQGTPMKTVSSMLLGFDTSVMSAREVRCIATCLRFKQPVFIAAVPIGIEECDTRPFMPVGTLVHPMNLPQEWSRVDGSPPGLLSGRDFTGITSPVAYDAIPHPWSSISRAVKWANREFQVPITPWVFGRLATLLWQEDPVTKDPVGDWDAPPVPEDILYVPFPVVEALASGGWIPWWLASRIETDQAAAFNFTAMATPIPLPQ